MKKAICICLGIFWTCYNAFGQNTQPGLDPTFGNNGISIDTHYNFFRIYDLALQPDGKIIVAGQSYVARYLSNGDLDSSFNKVGVVAVPASSISLLSNGKIIVSGNSSSGSLVLRLMPEGTIDSSFGINGMTLFCCGANKALVQNDGKIITIGEEDYEYAAIRRFTIDGKVDSAFGTHGLVKRQIGNGIDIAGFGILSDGRIAAVGDNGSSAWYARYLPDGRPDSLLGGAGITYPMGAIYCRYAIIETDGKVIVSKGGLNFNSDAEIVRLKTNGTVDSTYGKNGSINVPGLRIVSLLQLPDGKMLCGGFNDKDFAIARLNKEGSSIDFSFGKNGLITTDIAGGDRDRGYALALQTDGKILLAGESQKEITNVWYPPRASLARYLADAPVGISMPKNSPSEEIILYPNPTHGSFRILMPRPLWGGNMQLLNIAGKVLYQIKNVTALETIDVSSLSVGTYIVRVETLTAMQSKLFQKE